MSEGSLNELERIDHILLCIHKSCLFSRALGTGQSFIFDFVDCSSGTLIDRNAVESQSVELWRDFTVFTPRPTGLMTKNDQGFVEIGVRKVQIGSDGDSIAGVKSHRAISLILSKTDGRENKDDEAAKKIFHGCFKG